MKNLKNALFVTIFSIVTVGLLSGSLYGINTADTRMMTQPAISDSRLAFIYAEDLWVSNLDGTRPRRLTVDEGVESNPAFSPDGKLIAFSAEYDGNRDVFVVPVEGGVPVRLTWHPGADAVRGFTPDGRNVLFISQRNVFTNRYNQLFKVPVEGGYPVQLEIPNAYHACYSPDGKFMAYTPLSEAFRQWKNYRGGTISTIWIFSFEDHSVVEIPKPEGGCNDTYPMWIGKNINFLSDRNGEFNLFQYDRSSAEITQLTSFTDFPVLSASGREGIIVFEQAGFLHTYDLEKSESEKLTIGIAADLQELRPRFVKGDKYLRSANISPTGARAVVNFRGDIITLPAEKGDARNLTNTAGVHERYPAWSPDGKSIACFSDASGEYELHIRQQDGKGEVKAFQLDGTGFYAYINWSPDSKKIFYVDNGRNLFVIDIASGVITRIDTDELYEPGAFRDMFGDWAFDSQWFVYTRVTGTNFKRVYLYSLDQQKSFAVTDGLSDVTEPVFDRSGKYLYFFASTDAGPVASWFDMSNADMRMTKSLYLATLQKETVSPFAKESDEEVAEEENKETEEAEGNGENADEET
ncbi:MAG: peptidase S41, partial [Acidobacteriota bacterium]